MDKQRKTDRGLKVSAFICCLFCSLIWLSQAEAKKEVLRFDGSKMSADIDEVNLKDVFKRINAQKGFFFRGDSSVLDSKISIRFKNLSYQDGLKRILSHINHILLFDRNKEPSGVIIVGDGVSRKPISGKRSNRNIKRDATGSGRTVVSEVRNDEIEGLSAGSDLTPPSEIELASMVVDKDAQLPGGIVKVTPEELEGIKPTVEGGMTP